MSQITAQRIGVGKLLIFIVAFDPTATKSTAAEQPHVPPAKHARQIRTAALQSAQAKGNADLLKWYTGKLQFHSDWLTPAEATSAAEKDKRLTQYRELRAAMEDEGREHQRLARWCERENLTELAKVHWLHVLRFDANHDKALDALGLVWHRGILMDRDEQARYEIQEEIERQRAEDFRPQVKKLRRQLDGNDLKQRREAARELRELNDPAAAAVMAKELAEPGENEQQTRRRHAALVDGMAQVDDPRATYELVQMALNSPWESVRYAATTALKDRPLEEYVPEILAHLELPVTGSVRLSEQGNHLVSNYTLEQETAGGGTQERNYSTSQRIAAQKYSHATIHYKRKTADSYTIPGHTRRVAQRKVRGNVVLPLNVLYCSSSYDRIYETTYVDRYVPPEVVPAKYQYLGSRSIVGDELPGFEQQRHAAKQNATAQANQVANQVDQANARIKENNERLTGLLHEVTGQTLKAYPRSWWNWWRDHVEAHPEMALGGGQHRLEQAILDQQPRALARGVVVWTLQGQRPVEKLRIGDFVLSQDVRTGELAYKPILAMNAYPDMEMQRVQLRSDREADNTTAQEIVSGEGQIFFQAGQGWRRMSDLTSSAELHGLLAAVTFESSEETYAMDAYDVIVADFHTLFIGSQGLLTHDGTPVGATAQALPGFPRALVGQAKQVAQAR